MMRKESVRKMKISCSQEALLESVNVVTKAVPVKTTMPILECILVKAFNGQIILTASNMDLGIENQVKDGEIDEEGIVALDAKLFSDVVRNLPKSTVYIDTDEVFHTTIRCDKALYKIIGKSGQDFPALDPVRITDPVVMSQLALKEMIRQTAFAVSDNDANKMMTGILFNISRNNLRMVALDGHRISIRNCSLKESYPDVNVVVPGRQMNEINKILSSESNDMVSVYITPSKMIFEIEYTIMVIRLIDGEYFNYEKMIRNEFNTKIKVNRRELIEGVTRATLLVREVEARKNPVIVRIADDQMELIGNSAVGTMNESLPIVKEGADQMIGFNPKFLVEALKAIDDEEVTMYFFDSKSPCFIKNETESYIYLILPINFNNVR